MNLESLVKEISIEVVELAKKEASDYIEKAVDDAINFTKLTFDNLARWSKMYVSGDLTSDELKFLLNGQKDLLVMHSLTQAGVAASRIQRIRDGIIDILVGTLTSNIYLAANVDLKGIKSKNLVTAEYIWIDGSVPTRKLRSKTKIINLGNNDPSIADFPKWGFDGSSTNQATGNNSDCVLMPVALYPDYIKGGYLVLCEVYTELGEPHPTNTRNRLRLLMENNNIVNQKPIIGFEQEYMMFRENTPLGWPVCKFGLRAQPPPQGPYYCGVGADEVFGREIAEEHMHICISSNINICGINAEVCPGQWEFQCGYRGDNIDRSDPLTVSDDMWVARWLLYRISEKHGVTITINVKPVPGDWNGSGLHTNFSTDDMRSKDGIVAIENAIRRLDIKHSDHIGVYGHDLAKRLTGKHETCHINDFRWGIADRGASVRIPRHVADVGCGYFEDRRPGSNADPYEVSAALISTVCL